MAAFKYKAAAFIGKSLFIIIITTIKKYKYIFFAPRGNVTLL